MEDWLTLEEFKLNLRLALWLFIVYFAIYKLKEGINDKNNLYIKIY